jgi:hypothetical protein
MYVCKGVLYVIGSHDYRSREVSRSVVGKLETQERPQNSSQSPKARKAGELVV